RWLSLSWWWACEVTRYEPSTSLPPGATAMSAAAIRTSSLDAATAGSGSTSWRGVALGSVGRRRRHGASGLRRSWTNTSTTRLVSPATRLVAYEEKATKRPSALIARSKLWLFPASRSCPCSPARWCRSAGRGRTRPCTRWCPPARIGSDAQRHFGRPSPERTRRPGLAVGPQGLWVSDPPLDEHVPLPVGVPGHEVAGGRGEGHDAAVGAERGVAAHPHPLRRPRLPVVHEHAGGVPEVGGGRGEGHEAAVGADRGVEAIAVRRVPGAVHAHPLSRPGLPVANEHLRTPAGASRHKVGGQRPEGHEAAVGADRDRAGGAHFAPAAPVIPLIPGAVYAHPLGDAGLPVVDEHVGDPVGIPGDEVAGARGEGHEAAVGADRGTAAPPIPLVPGAVHAHPLGDSGCRAGVDHGGDPERAPRAGVS